MNKRNKIHWEPYFQFFISICWLYQEAARWRSTVTRRTGAGTAGAGRGATSPGAGGDTAGTSLSLNDVLDVNADFLHYKETAGRAVSSLPCLTTTRPPCLPTPRRVTRSFPSGRANSSRSSGRRTRMDSTGGSAEGGLATCRATWSPRSRWTTRGWPGSCWRQRWLSCIDPKIFTPFFLKKTPKNLSFETQITPIFSLKPYFCAPLERI